MTGPIRLDSVTYVIARTARQRPTLMHRVMSSNPHATACGVQIVGWSRAYFTEPIPQVLCLRCKRDA